MKSSKKVHFDLQPIIYFYQIPKEEKNAEQDKRWEIFLESLESGSADYK